MSRKGLDKYGNPLPPRPWAPGEEARQAVLFDPPAQPQVPASSGRAELHDALRVDRRRLRKEGPRPPDYRFWGEVRVGDRVALDLLHQGVITRNGVHTERVGEATYVVNYAIVQLDNNDEVEVRDLSRLKRIPGNLP